jgi:hypothetical protein
VSLNRVVVTFVFKNQFSFTKLLVNVLMPMSVKTVLNPVDLTHKHALSVRVFLRKIAADVGSTLDLIINSALIPV